MLNARLDEAQAGIKIARRNINSLRYADDTTLMAESKEELKFLLMKLKEESEKVSLKFNIQKTKTQVFTPGGQSIGDSASTSVLPKNIQTDFLWDGLVGSPCSPRDSQETSPIPQFKTINSSVLSHLNSPTLTSIHDHWKNHSLDKMDLCWQSNVSAF